MNGSFETWRRPMPEKWTNPEASAISEVPDPAEGAKALRMQLSSGEFGAIRSGEFPVQQGDVLTLRALMRVASGACATESNNAILIELAHGEPRGILKGFNSGESQDWSEHVVDVEMVQDEEVYLQINGAGSSLATAGALLDIDGVSVCVTRPR
jgi:hypothetical protein